MNEALSPALEGVAISASAARRLNAILKGEEGAALRISVKGGGCSGFQYAFDVERTRADDDVAVTRDGATVLVDPVSLEMLKGRRARFRRRPDGPVVPGEEPECGRLLRLRGELHRLARCLRPVDRHREEARGVARRPSFDGL